MQCYACGHTLTLGSHIHTDCAPAANYVYADCRGCGRQYRAHECGEGFGEDTALRLSGYVERPFVAIDDGGARHEYDAENMDAARDVAIEWVQSGDYAEPGSVYVSVCDVEREYSIRYSVEVG